jgi:hypothetical protein
MWNEASVAGGDTEGLKVSHVMDVGRNWFRMTPVAPQKTARIAFEGTTLPHVRIAESLFDRTVAPGEPTRALKAVKRRGSVTAPLWLLVVAGAALLVTGAAATVAAFRLQPATIVSAFTTYVPEPAAAQPAARTVVEPIVAPVVEPIATTIAPSVTELAPAPTLADNEPTPVAKPVAKAPPRRARPAPSKRATPSAADEPVAAKVWVDPFAE